MYLMFFFFFFFKQKTAYEIPKRDWSSDVCSSDLNASAVEGNGGCTTTPMPFAGTLSASSSQTVTVNYQTGTVNYQTFTIALTQTPRLSVANASAVEGNGGCTTTPMPFAVTLSASSSQTVTVNYQTVNGTASGDATCTTRSKGYIPTSGTLTFAPGETSKTVNVPIVGDTAKESNQTLAFRLSNATNATLPASDRKSTRLN